jgi:hypothetical protein
MKTEKEKPTHRKIRVVQKEAIKQFKDACKGEIEKRMYGYRISSEWDEALKEAIEILNKQYKERK